MKQRKLQKEFFFLVPLFIFAVLNFFLNGNLVKPISHFFKDGLSFLIHIPRNTIKKKDAIELLSSIYEKELTKEVEELKKALSLGETLMEYEPIYATTVYRNPNLWRNEIVIDKGSFDGIEEGMPVMVLEGLVGRVKDVGNHSSTIELLTKEVSPKISVKIETEDGYLYGILARYRNQDDVFEVEGISEQKNVKQGSIVTTTGMGEYYPAGIYVGKTSAIHKDHFDLAETVDVKSDVVFEDVSIVTVLKKKGVEK